MLLLRRYASSSSVPGSGTAVGLKLLKARPKPVVLLPTNVMRTLSNPVGRPENEKTHGKPSSAALLPNGGKF